MIEIPFLPEFESPVLQGRKTATTRTKSYGKPGDRFIAFGMTFQLVSVTRLPLGHVAELYYYEEGFSGPASFIAVWERLHFRKKFDPSQLVYFHQFVKVF